MKIKTLRDLNDLLDVENPEAPHMHSYRALTQGTVVKLHGQFGGTPNFLEDRLLDTSSRVFPEKLSCGEKTRPECQWYHLMNKRSRGRMELEKQKS